ncbi:hypothetical protein HPB50_027013 [Hyalomma asiaticum]|uniref:Uncharacterized protein n=1 Tax=Hyalomma asiaticum TaxID=266040 RepID=A0ACB7SL45_HYAAI|nr:hypothetical protein HPB50_027013 [Hyalomma asiaticum]
MGKPGKHKSQYVGEQWTHGMRLRAFSDGALEVKCSIGGHDFKCTFDKHRKVRATSMPLAIVAAVREDIEWSSLERAIAVLPKRLKAYVLRRQQIEDTERKHASRLADRKLLTCSGCTFVRMDLALTVVGQKGVLRLEMGYDDFSVHPSRVSVKSRGAPEFVDKVCDKVDDIRGLVLHSPLDEACSMLCS